MEKIIVYASEGCPKCKALKQKLESKHIPFEVCTDVEYMVNEKGFVHVPMLEVDGSAMGYKEALKWASER